MTSHTVLVCAFEDLSWKADERICEYSLRYLDQWLSRPVYQYCKGDQIDTENCYLNCMRCFTALFGDFYDCHQTGLLIRVHAPLLVINRSVQVLWYWINRSYQALRYWIRSNLYEVWVMQHLSRSCNFKGNANAGLDCGAHHLFGPCAPKYAARLHRCCSQFYYRSPYLHFPFCTPGKITWPTGLGSPSQF